MSTVSATSFDLLHMELATQTIKREQPAVAMYRLDAMGFDAVMLASRRSHRAQGQRLAEKYSLKHEPRLVGDLQVVKWVCKVRARAAERSLLQDFWQRTFRKDIDTLKTDYQGATASLPGLQLSAGTFLLCDNDFRVLQPFLAGSATKVLLSLEVVLWLSISLLI